MPISYDGWAWVMIGFRPRGNFIATCPFVAEGRFVHGDVTIRNVGIYSYRPIVVGLFDPNPLSGDPSWDIAPMMNNVAFNELRNRRESVPPKPLTHDRDLATGFWESYGGILRRSRCSRPSWFRQFFRPNTDRIV